MTLPYITPSHLINSPLAEAGPLDFVLPPELEATAPPEARGLSRDGVRLMVSYRSDDRIVHTQFRQIGDFLEAGDLLVINTSGTMKAALNTLRSDGTPLELHLSTHLPADLWVVEARTSQGEKPSMPFYDLEAGETLHLPGGAEARLLVPHSRRDQSGPGARHRLWIATLTLPAPLHDYLEQYGFPIRYSYVPEPWPIEYYQLVYATETGSAEMPSAGRAFTPELITALVAKGVQVAPLILHTGVASPEANEPPYEEFYRVPAATAALVNMAHESGRRVIAVGTTVIRALETVTDERGITHAGEGWTNVVITSERGIHAVNALLTGLHEPQATHLWMLSALATTEHLKLAYRAALQKGYLWHEFGDLHLILP
jgi:S-adenosylmethionine:tRNA ribosyltransferase-isomerase